MNGRFFNGMTSIIFPPFDGSRESILIPLFPSTLISRPSPACQRKNPRVNHFGVFGVRFLQSI